MKRNQNGVTIIALTVTVIVTIILASVSLSAIIGENSMVETAVDLNTKENVSEVINDIKNGLNRWQYYKNDRGTKNYLSIETNTDGDLDAFKSYIEGTVNSISNDGTKLVLDYTFKNINYTVNITADGSVTAEAQNN